MNPRLTSAMLVAALLRRVHDAGGSGVVVARGDPGAGSIVLLGTERGVATGQYERILGADGGYRWQSVGPDDGDPALWLARKRMSDPDLWVIELDIADAQRFAAETSGDG